MPDIRHSIEIAAPPEALFRLVSAAWGLSQWWAEDIRSGEKGAVELGFFNRSTTYRLHPEGMVPGRSAVWRCDSGKEWMGTRIVFALEQANSGTILRFEHAAWREITDYFVSCNTTWGGLLFRLKAAAEGKNPGPLFTNGGIAS
jgi:uncharacterized protein YndB with AHSA1/START domain